MSGFSGNLACSSSGRSWFRFMTGPTSVQSGVGGMNVHACRNMHAVVHCAASMPKLILRKVIWDTSLMSHSPSSMENILTFAAIRCWMGRGAEMNPRWNLYESFEQTTGCHLKRQDHDSQSCIYMEIMGMMRQNHPKSA